MDIQDIKKIFQDAQVDIDRDDIWKVQTATVVKHKALERLAAKLNIKYDQPQILRAERDEAVILVTGKLGDRTEWSIGEAAINGGDGLPGNYKVSGRQAAYPYAMAEKRAKDRVILKLAGLHGVYSEEEADDFKDNSKKEEVKSTKPATKKAEKAQEGKAEEDPANFDDVVAMEETIKMRIDKADSVKGVTDFMLSTETQDALNTLPQKSKDEMRDYAKARMVALGWPGKKSE